MTTPQHNNTEIEKILADYIPHYGHQYCNEVCPRYRATQSIEALIIQGKMETTQELSGKMVKAGIPVGDYATDDALSDVGRVLSAHHQELQKELEANE